MLKKRLGNLPIALEILNPYSLLSKDFFCVLMYALSIFTQHIIRQNIFMGPLFVILFHLIFIFIVASIFAFVFTIFSAFAQFERDMIVTRTQEGKNYAKQNDPNFKEGRPKTYSDEQINFAYELREQGMTYKMIYRKTGISIRTQQRRYRELKKE